MTPTGHPDPRRAGDARQRGSQAQGYLLVGAPAESPAAEGLRLSGRRTTVRQAPLPLEECGVPMRARKGDLTVRLRCKQWGCASCGPWLKARLRRSIIATCNARPNLRRFYTLTLPGEWHRGRVRDGQVVPNPSWNGATRIEAYQELNRVWAKFAKRMERSTGHRLAYGSVREPHADGTPHIHGIIDDFLPWAKLRDLWNESGGGYADIRYVDTSRVAGYLSKYLSKDGNPPPKGCRKYATGGGVKFENVRPPRPAPRGELVSEWVVERMEVDGSWHPVRMRGHFKGLRDAMVASAELRRLRDVAVDLVVCVVCGADHEVHRT